MLPKSAVEQILAVKIDGQFSSVAAELREAYASGPLGQNIFGRVVALVLDSRLEEIIRKQIEVMLAKAKITGEDVLACKRAIASMVEGLPGVDAVICSKGCLQPYCPLCLVLFWFGCHCSSNGLQTQTAPGKMGPVRLKTFFSCKWKGP